MKAVKESTNLTDEITCCMVVNERMAACGCMSEGGCALASGPPCSRKFYFVARVLVSAIASTVHDSQARSKTSLRLDRCGRTGKFRCRKYQLPRPGR